MAQKIINIGTGPNSGDGEGLRSAFSKTVDNFAELYGHANSTSNPHNVTAAQVGALAISLLDQPLGVAGLDATGKLKSGQKPSYALSELTSGDLGFTLTPSTTSSYDLGSSAKKWNNLYVNNVVSTSFTANSTALTFTNNAVINFVTTATSTDLIQINGKAAIRKASDLGGMQIGCDDVLILGAGEAAATAASNLGGSGLTAEDVRVVADGAIYLQSGLQSGWAARKTMSFDVNAVLTIDQITLRPWTATDTDIDGLIPGTSTGSILDGQGAGHFVVGIRSNDANDGFYVLDKGNASTPISDPYTNVLLGVSRNGFTYLGNTVLTSANTGSGNGLDADKLDSYDSTAFPRKAEAATISGGWTFDTTYTNFTFGQDASNNPGVRIGSTGKAGKISFARGSDGNAVGVIGYQTQSDSGELTIRSDGGAGFLTLYTGAVERMRIVNAGRVLIGTTSDSGSQQLQVAGRVKFSNFSTGGSITFQESGSLGSQIIFNSNGAAIHNNGGVNEIMAYYAPTSAGVHNFYANGTATLAVSNTAITYKGLTVWHSGNDGAGSGLDADLLDGQSGPFYQNATNITAGVLSPSFGGTGITSYTANNYVRAQSASVLEQRTPDQVRTDIAAAKSTIASSAPSSPNAGDEWIDTTTGVRYTWYVESNQGQWVEMGPSGVLPNSVPIVISNTQPNITTQYMWIQTGLGDDGSGISFWINI